MLPRSGPPQPHSRKARSKHSHLVRAQTSVDIARMGPRSRLAWRESTFPVPARTVQFSVVLAGVCCVVCDDGMCREVQSYAVLRLHRHKVVSVVFQPHATGPLCHVWPRWVRHAPPLKSRGWTETRAYELVHLTTNAGHKQHPPAIALQTQIMSSQSKTSTTVKSRTILRQVHRIALAFPKPSFSILPPRHEPTRPNKTPRLAQHHGRWSEHRCVGSRNPAASKMSFSHPCP